MTQTLDESLRDILDYMVLTAQESLTQYPDRNFYPLLAIGSCTNNQWTALVTVLGEELASMSKEAILETVASYCFEQGIKPQWICLSSISSLAVLNGADEELEKIAKGLLVLIQARGRLPMMSYWKEVREGENVKLLPLTIAGKGETDVFAPFWEAVRKMEHLQVRMN